MMVDVDVDVDEKQGQEKLAKSSAEGKTGEDLSILKISSTESEGSFGLDELTLLKMVTVNLYCQTMRITFQDIGVKGNSLRIDKHKCLSIR